MIKFDLTSIPTEQTITSAIITFKDVGNYGHLGKDFFLQPLLSEWDDSTVTWDNKPRWGKNIGYGINDGAYYSWVITNSVKLWVANPDTNFGFLMSAVEVGVAALQHHADFASSEHSDESARPTITIVTDGNTPIETQKNSVAKSALLIKQNFHSLDLFTPFSGECKISIYNTLGKQIYSSRINAKNGWNGISADLASGTHILKVSSSTDLFVRNFTILH